MKFPQTAAQSKAINPLIGITANTAADNAQPRASSRFEDNLKQQVSAGGNEAARRSSVRAQDNSTRSAERSNTNDGSSLPSDEQKLPPAADQAVESERIDKVAEEDQADRVLSADEASGKDKTRSAQHDADDRLAANAESSLPVADARTADTGAIGDDTGSDDADPLWRFEATVEPAPTTGGTEASSAGWLDVPPNSAAQPDVDAALRSADALRAPAPVSGSAEALITASDTSYAGAVTTALDPLALRLSAASILHSMASTDGTQSMSASVSPVLSLSGASSSAPATPPLAASDWTTVAAHRLSGHDGAPVANAWQPTAGLAAVMPGAQSAELASAPLPANALDAADVLPPAARSLGSHDKGTSDSRSAATTASWLESLLGQNVAVSRSTLTLNTPAVPVGGAELILVADTAPLPQSSSGTATGAALANTLYSLEQRQLAAAEARQALAQQAPAAGTGAGQGLDSSTRAGALELAFGQTGWADRLGRQLLLQSAQGSSSARIRLDPPELGSLTVRIQLVDQSAAVNFVSPHAMVRDALEQQSARLQDMFREQGMDLLDVSVSDHSADTGDGRQQSGHQGSATPADTGPVADAGLLPAQRVSDALIDYYA